MFLILGTPRVYKSACRAASVVRISYWLFFLEYEKVPLTVIAKGTFSHLLLYFLTSIPMIAGNVQDINCTQFAVQQS